MSAPPFQKFFWGSYHKHTSHLSDAREHGAYLLLIGALWNNDGKLPADDVILAGYAKVTVAEWEAMKPKLMPLFRVARGKLTQKRVTEDLAKYEVISSKRKRAGKAGGAASGGKRIEIREANASDLPTYTEPEPEPEEVVAVVERASADATADDWPDGDAQAHAAILTAITASPFLDPDKSPMLVTTAGRLVAWRRDGASWERDVVPTVAGLCRGRNSPISTWKFFDSAIAQSLADSRRPIQIQTQRQGHERSDPDNRSARYVARLGDIDAAMAAAFEQPASRYGSG